MGGAISQTTQDLLDNAANPPSQTYQRRPSIATPTSLTTLLEVDETEQNDPSNFLAAPSPTPTSTEPTSTPTTTHHPPLTTSLMTTFQPPLQHTNIGRPVLVTRTRQTQHFDTTKINKASLLKAAKALNQLLRTIDYEEKQYKFAQKKHRQHIIHMQRQEQLGTRKRAKTTPPTPAPPTPTTPPHSPTQQRPPPKSPLPPPPPPSQPPLPPTTTPTPEWITVVSIWQAQNGVAIENIQPSDFIVHSPDRIRIVTRLVAVLIRLGAFERAQHLWEETMEKCIEDFGFEHPHACHATIGLAYVLLERDHPLLAQVACRRGLTGLKKVVGEMHPLTRYARRLLIRIVHKLSLLKPHYYEEQEQLLREDFHVEQQALTLAARTLDTKNDGNRKDNDRGDRGQGGGNSLFAHYNLASFCVHFGRYDEAASILRASVATMTTSMLNASENPPLRRDMHALSTTTAKLPGKPPSTPPKRKKCPYALKHMALNQVSRIESAIQKYQQIAVKWENQVQATVEAGHPRSASFYQTKVEIANTSVQQLKAQKIEIEQQEIAREDLIARREIQEKHTFARTVLRREKLDYERIQNEMKLACGEDGVPASESTHLDLLPQAWECVNLLAELLERKLQGSGRSTYKEEDMCEREELDVLLEWLRRRQEEHVKVVDEW